MIDRQDDGMTIQVGTSRSMKSSDTKAMVLTRGARARLDKASPLFAADPVPVRGVVNLAGTIDMADNIPRMEKECRDTVVTGMPGGTREVVPERYAQASAITLVPLGIPALVCGEHEEFVPLPLAAKYARAAMQAGDSVRVVVVPGAGHFELASPYSSAWPEVRSVIRTLLVDSFRPMALARRIGKGRRKVEAYVKGS